jgi:hypothetical protein
MFGKWLWAHRKTVGIVLLVLVTIGSIGYLVYRVNTLTREKHVAQANLRVALDSLTYYQNDAATLRHTLGRAIIQGQIRDSQLTQGLAELAKQLRTSQQALATLQVRVDSAIGATTQTPLVVAGTRTVVDTVIGPPIDGTIIAVAPVDTTAPMTVEHRLVPTGYEIHFSLGCRTEEPYDAVLGVDAPTWVQVRWDVAQVDPEVCQGPPPRFLGLSPPKAFLVGGAAGAVTAGGLLWILSEIF